MPRKPTLVENVDPVTVTFNGGIDTGDVGKCVWGNARTGTVTFPLNRAVVIDPSQAANGALRQFLVHVIGKVKSNPFFTVEEGDLGEPSVITMPESEPVSARKLGRKDGEE